MLLEMVTIRYRLLPLRISNLHIPMTPIKSRRDDPVLTHTRKVYFLATIRRPHLLPLLFRGFLHGFPLFLVCLVQRLLLLLDRLLGLARIFLGTDALRVSRY